MVQFSGPPGAIREERTLTDVLCCHQTVTEKLLIVTTKIVNFSQMKIEEYHALILYKYLAHYWILWVIRTISKPERNDSILVFYS